MPWSGVAPYVAEDVIHRRTCLENPSLEGIVTQQYAGYPQESCRRSEQSEQWKADWPVEQWKTTGCLGYIGDYTTQLCGDYNKPLQGPLLNNQYNGK